MTWDEVERDLQARFGREFVGEIDPLRRQVRPPDLGCVTGRGVVYHWRAENVYLRVEEYACYAFLTAEIYSARLSPSTLRLIVLSGLLAPLLQSGLTVVPRSRYERDDVV